MTDIVLAAFIEGDQVLMARRGEHEKQFPGHWDLIGGHVEAEEAVEAALVREAEEELGLTPTIFRDVGTFNDIGTVSFVRCDRMIDRPKLLGDEHSELTWVRVSEATFLHPLAHPKIMSAVSLV